MTILSVWLLRINLGIILHSFLFFFTHFYQLYPENISAAHRLLQTTMTTSLLQIVPLTLIFDLLPTKNLFYLLGQISYYLPLYFSGIAFCSGPDHPYSDLWYLWASFHLITVLGLTTFDLPYTKSKKARALWHPPTPLQFLTHLMPAFRANSCDFNKHK